MRVDRSHCVHIGLGLTPPANMLSSEDAEGSSLPRDRQSSCEHPEDAQDGLVNSVGR